MWLIKERHSDRYLASCDRFVSDDRAFAKFKRDRAYTVILEHLGQQGGQAYLEAIDPAILDPDGRNIKRFRENDRFGKPRIYRYPDVGDLSPSTIRYVKTVSDIRRHFGTDGLNTVVEVGGGYGGLAKTFSVIYPFISYTLADEPRVNALSRKYLALFPDLNGRIHHIDCDQIPDAENIDLFISAYALSELSPSSQQEYYDKLISHSQRFYVVYNHFGDYGAFVEMVSRDFDIDTEPDSFGDSKVVYGMKRPAHGTGQSGAH